MRAASPRRTKQHQADMRDSTYRSARVAAVSRSPDRFARTASHVDAAGQLDCLQNAPTRGAETHDERLKPPAIRQDDPAAAEHPSTSTQSRLHAVPRRPHRAIPTQVAEAQDASSVRAGWGAGFHGRDGRDIMRPADTLHTGQNAHGSAEPRSCRTLDGLLYFKTISFFSLLHGVESGLRCQGSPGIPTGRPR